MINGEATLLVYEDQYCGELHSLVKGLRKDAGHPGRILEFASVRGTGNFAREVPKLLRLPLRPTKRPPDRLVCVADADKPGNLTPGAGPPPTDALSLDTWIIALEEGWKNRLIQGASLPSDATARLRTVCLRWNKESLLVACPDALMELASEADRSVELTAVLKACDPSPLELSDAHFVHRYRAPDQCMRQVIQAIHQRPYKKGIDDEDLLRTRIRLSAVHRAQLAARCPDLRRLLDALNS